MSRTLVIAEAGVNHNGNLKLAFKLIEAAAEAGADVVKFQSFQAQKLAIADAEKAPYQKETTGASENQLAMLQKLELTQEQHLHLIDHCKKRGIEFLSTAFDSNSLRLLENFNLKRFKIPSGEITNLPYLRKIAAYKKPLILSTGMANLGDIEAAIEALEQAGSTRNQITVLHCTTEYPAPENEVNLRAMQSIATAFDVAVGYSDHTNGIAVSIAAVAMGATVIEKHLTLDQTMEGPDHKASLEPDQFAMMIQSIRTVEEAMGDGVKRPTASEHANLLVVRKSIVASHTIRAGEPFTTENITTKRPGSGISPMSWDDLIGRKATRDYALDEMIEW
tara:strand:- start:2066 stop:3070 length:1005 start_codon:yes stop_codon:yes gene_type:complete